jgi:uncharacterized membrane protein
MPKRKGYLMAQIADPDNLRLAFYKAARGRQLKEEVIEYRKNLDAHLHLLHKQLLAGTVPIGIYHYFTVYDPKERVICAASFNERVMHHAIMNICHPIFERFLIYDTYATRIGKGQFAALDRAKIYAKKYTWFCKMDIRKYFDSIDHNILFEKLQSKFKDHHLLELFHRIIASYSTKEGKGVPIGNLTSQYFANFYLGLADRFIKETLGVKAYIRYMDDMVFFGHCNQELLDIANRLSAFIDSSLKLIVKPICLNSIEKGLPFLGYVVYRDGIKLNKNSKKRFIQKMKRYTHNLYNEIWSQTQYAKHVSPLIAFTQHANSAALRRALLCKLEIG